MKQREEVLELFAQVFAMKVHVCLNTSNLGCHTVCGNFSCEKIKSVVKESAGNLGAYTSGCRCASHD